ncbi:imidazole glycerol phosphate synthase subunit HisH [Tenericutes bacterium MZ-XQ]|nr:imidazole glycerol phosphate synthase subunit HisH [Tenericutes bacterium MZ-XQ]
MNVILDYDSGNLESVLKAFNEAGIKTIISKDKDIIEQATSLVLPGVGAFRDAMDALKTSGLIPLIKKHVNQKKYLFGICLGMQLLYEFGYEYGRHEGLGFLKGDVKYLDIDLKVPHMGWNELYFKKKDPILKYISEKDYVYFVHSYYVSANSNEVLSFTTYEEEISAIIRKDNIYATQFHPEKSGLVGANILKAYKEILDDYIASN